MWIRNLVGALVGIIGLFLGVFDYISCKPWESPSGCPWDIENVPPKAQSDEVKILENQTINIDVLANDSDEDMESLKIHSFSSPLHGQITLSQNIFHYQPKQEFVGEDFFSYTIIDNQGQSAEATVKVLISAPPSNRPPIARADQATTEAGQSIEINVLANDFDPEQDGLKIFSISQPLTGEVTLAGNKLNYHPKPKFVGQDQFTYQIRDKSGQIAQAPVNVTILPTNPPPIISPKAEPEHNRPPLAQADQVTTSQGHSVICDVLANDSDPDDDPIQIISFSNAANGQITLLEDQTLRYTPLSQFVGNDHFSYVIGDNHGHNVEAQVTVTITGSISTFSTLKTDSSFSALNLKSNSSLIEYPKLLNTEKNKPIEIEIFFAHYDSANFELSSINNAANGEVNFSQKNKLQYTPHLDFSGFDQFSYLINDKFGNINEIQVIIHVNK